MRNLTPCQHLVRYQSCAAHRLVWIPAVAGMTISVGDL